MQKYQLDTEENLQFLEKVRQNLFDFGRRFPSPGGGSYYLMGDGTPDVQRPRETWITCRMAHVYALETMLGGSGGDSSDGGNGSSSGDSSSGNGGSVDSGSGNDSGSAAALADAAIGGLLGELRDEEHSGWYAGRTADGGILPDKQCYAHAFVLLAASSAKLAGNQRADALLKEALEVYDRFFWNEEEGLSCDTWNTEFTQCSSYRGLNANMHTVEAFLAVADSEKDETYRERAGRIIRHVIGWAEQNQWRIPEHFTADWTPDYDCNKDHPDDPFKPYGATPGHGIEWARLITQWALSADITQEEKTAAIESAEQLYKRAAADGWNPDGGAGGLVYTTDWDGNAVVHDRMHWTLAEAINTSAVLYRAVHRDEYAADYAKYMEYLDRVVLDHEHGSWFHQLDADGRVLDTVWPGKSDLYHAVQATLIPYADPAVSIGTFTARG